MNADQVGESLYETLRSRRERGRSTPGYRPRTSSDRGGSLKEFLGECERAGLKLRGARGNRVEDVLELLEVIRVQQEISRRSLCAIAGIARSNYDTLMNSRRPNPSLKLIIRIAKALDHQLDLVEIGEPAGLPSGTTPRDDDQRSSDHHQDASNAYNQYAGYTGSGDPYLQQLKNLERQIMESHRRLELAFEARRRYDMVVTTTCFGAGMATATIVPHLVEQGPGAALTCAVGGVAAIATGYQSYAGTEAGRALTAAGTGLLVGAATFGLLRLVEHLTHSNSSGAKVQTTR